jgi:hypothetical protein
MDLQAAYRKTAKGEEEIATRSYRLASRLRSVLVMADGKILGGELLRRAAMLGDGEALLATLLEGGFVEATGNAAAASAAPAPAAFGDAHKAAARFAAHYLLEALGPASDMIGARIESCRDAATLRGLLESAREAVRAGAGRKRAEDFWAALQARLPGLE